MPGTHYCRSISALDGNSEALQNELQERVSPVSDLILRPSSMTKVSGLNIPEVSKAIGTKWWLELRRAYFWVLAFSAWLATPTLLLWLKGPHGMVRIINLQIEQVLHVKHVLCKQCTFGMDKA